jgi:hypothetical protein
MALTNPPVYRPDLFVNREQEIETVNRALQNIARGGGDAEQVRTIVFRGERGLGKSWLALHLHRSVLREEAPRMLPDYRIVSLFVSLSPPPEGLTVDEREWHITHDDAHRIAGEDETHYEALLQKLVAWVAEQLGITRAPYAPVRDLSAWLAQDVKQKLESEPHLVICLILDSVFETNWSFLDHLERYLLAAFAALPRVLIVMTGRGRPYLWKSPYLRTEREDQSLTPFSVEQVVEQIRRSLSNAPNRPPAVARLSDEELKRLAQQLAQRVIDLGGGYPLTNELLASAFVRQALDRMPEGENLEQALDRETISADVLDAVARRLLEVIPEERRDRLREAFDALCVLKDGFRENEMPYLLAELRNTKPEGSAYSISAMRELRDRLLETNLVRWQDKRYVLDEAVRTVLEQYLKLQRRDVWRRLHACAADLYATWARKYPGSRGYFDQRAVYHRSILGEDAAHSDEQRGRSL